MLVDKTPPAAQPARIAAGGEKTHIPVLDGVRAVAVLMVIHFHFWQVFGSGSSVLLQKLVPWGQTGVDLFFVLSGFLITGILLDSKGSAHYLRNFYVRRILRIFPLYYATLLAIFIICPLLHWSAWIPWRDSGWYWFYLQNIPMTFSLGPITGPGHFWSLAVEEHYYFLWPLTVLILDRRRLLRVTGLAIGVTIFTRIALIPYQTFYFTLARLDGLAIGSAVAIVCRSRPTGLSDLVTPARRMLCTFGPVLIVAQLCLSGRGLEFLQVVKSTLIAFCYAAILVLAIEGRLGRVTGAFLTSRPMRSIGKYSYAMYVLHPFVLSGLQKDGLRAGVAGLLVTVLATYLAAWVSWVLLESRFLKLKRYFEYSSPGPARLATQTVAG